MLGVLFIPTSLNSPCPLPCGASAVIGQVASRRGPEEGEEMIHWAFLIPTFIAGFAAGYAFLYLMAKIGTKVDAAIEEAFKYVR